MKAGLTKRQAKLLAFIRSHIVEKGHSPTYAEMCVFLGITSRSTIHYILRLIEARGHVRLTPHKSCSVELVDWLQLPPDLEQQIRDTAQHRGESPNQTLARIVRHGLLDDCSLSRETPKPRAA
jgi:SOS-response transcriptional repressor LexA